MISLAFLAGVLAAFNPCGFVLLPAYLTSIILGENSTKRTLVHNARAAKFSIGMTLGFIGVFGIFALVLTSFSGVMAKILPFLTITIGILLIIIALSLIRDKILVLRKLANPNTSPTQTWSSQIGYGISFALASLSCTVGPFLAITATAIRSRDAFKIFSLFLSYSLGMGSVVLVLALLVAAAKSRLIDKIKRSQRKISIISGYFLFFVGFYEIWYGWYEIRILRGTTNKDPVISFMVSIQSSITQKISNIGTGPLVLGAALITSTLLILGLIKRDRKPS